MKTDTMSLWKLEVLRLTRTKRWIALLAVYLLFGLLGPLTAKYLGEILGVAGGELEGAVIEFPDPVPADGMIQYVSNAGQIGTLVAMVVAAGALAFDSIPEMGVFLRTRVPRVWDILLPRLVVALVAAIAQVSRSILATVITSVVILLVMPLFGLVDAISSWMPTSLLNALAEIPAGTEASSYLGATGITVAVSAVLVWIAVKAAGRRLS